MIRRMYRLALPIRRRSMRISRREFSAQPWGFHDQSSMSSTLNALSTRKLPTMSELFFETLRLQIEDDLVKDVPSAMNEKDSELNTAALTRRLLICILANCSIEEFEIACGTAYRGMAAEFTKPGTSFVDHPFVTPQVGVLLDSQLQSYRDLHMRPVLDVAEVSVQLLSMQTEISIPQIRSVDSAKSSVLDYMSFVSSSALYFLKHAMGMSTTSLDVSVLVKVTSREKFALAGPENEDLARPDLETRIHLMGVRLAARNIQPDRFDSALQYWVEQLARPEAARREGDSLDLVRLEFDPDVRICSFNKQIQAEAPEA